MAKVKKESRPRKRELKHLIYTKTLNRKRNLAGCSGKSLSWKEILGVEENTK